MVNQNRIQLSGNVLKIIAAAAMVIDHVGLMFFPGNALFRVIGRLAFPIFAFMIAEGCRYTRNRKRYLGNMLLLAAVCQVVYFLAGGSLYFSILCTFSLSICMIYVLQYWRTKPTALSSLALVGAIGGVYLLNQFFSIDYGFWGCMVPVFAALPVQTGHIPRIALLGIGLVFLSLSLGGMQFWCLAAIPLLLLYSGKRGKYKMKMFFYVFYPVHLAVLQLLAWIIS